DVLLLAATETHAPERRRDVRETSIHDDRDGAGIVRCARARRQQVAELELLERIGSDDARPDLRDEGLVRDVETGPRSARPSDDVEEDALEVHAGGEARTKVARHVRQENPRKRDFAHGRHPRYLTPYDDLGVRQ